MKQHELDNAIEILRLADENCPGDSGMYLLGLTVAHLQATGLSLDAIQDAVAKTFNTSWEEARAYSEMLDRPRGTPS